MKDEIVQKALYDKESSRKELILVNFKLHEA